ncbi:G2/mitotic-specific cyclin-B1-like [Pelobates fuscus]|uniref:G2/mitotic-specific cyclin-B1-like n=1 Tax=Pelobates fuscus TaxID=191477 RepID=UPI002FE4CBF0
MAACLLSSKLQSDDEKDLVSATQLRPRLKRFGLRRRPVLRYNENKKSIATVKRTRKRIQRRYFQKRRLLPKITKAHLEYGSARLVASTIYIMDHPVSTFMIQVFDVDVDAYSDAVDTCAHANVCGEYAKDTYSYLKQLEMDQTIRYHYLNGQNITPTLRAITVNWLVRIHLLLCLNQETLFTGVCILDRFLQANPLDKKMLQLAGLTSLFIASKYEEPTPKPIAKFVSSSIHHIPVDQIKEMELQILVALEFKVGTATSLQFLWRASRVMGLEPFSHTYAEFLMELAMTDYDMVHMAPSKIATAACYLTMTFLEERDWHPVLQFYMGHSEEDIMVVVYHLAKNLVKNYSKRTLERVVFDKYDTEEYDNMSSIPLFYMDIFMTWQGKVMTLCDLARKVC